MKLIETAYTDMMTTYHQVGGLKTFRRLARVFYERVACDPLLERLFSKKADRQRERLALFLAETFGGPKRYSQERGKQRKTKASGVNQEKFVPNT
jgi:hemoglobin